MMRIEGWAAAGPGTRVELAGRVIAREWWYRTIGGQVAIVFRRPDDGRPRYCAAWGGEILRSHHKRARSWASALGAARAVEHEVDVRLRRDVTPS